MAKFDREELLKLLTLAAPALAKTAAIKERMHFWFMGKYVYAYDGGLGIRLPLPEDSGLECGLPGKMLLDLLRTSSLSEATLEVTKGDAVLQLGKAKLKLVALSGDRHTWPFPEAPAKNSRPLKLSKELLEAFGKVMFVKAQKADYAIHHGVSVTSDDGVTAVAATDSKTIVYTTVAQDANIPNCLLPWAFLKAATELSIPDSILYIMEPNAEKGLRCLFLESEGRQVCSNLLGYPDDVDLAGVVNKHLGDNPVKLPSELKLILDRARILSSGEEALITLASRGTFLEVSGRWVLGSLSEKLPLEKSIDDASGRFLAEFVERGMPYADLFYLSDKALVLCDDEETFFYVVGAKTDVKSKAKPEEEEAEEEEAEEAPKKEKVTRRRKAA